MSQSFPITHYVRELMGRRKNPEGLPRACRHCEGPEAPCLEKRRPGLGRLCTSVARKLASGHQCRTDTGGSLPRRHGITPAAPVLTPTGRSRDDEWSRLSTATSSSRSHWNSREI